ncbi:hypothetical protein EX30DRAFT_351748 [Ascodesmis nigricans]|uniref:Uncharacterized protein n=1 Tax=Ascodesmis nigricans TaxID=341454 RepID=A0A4S2MRG0_9PEZI|nr:hypothetical protein EX30DRAFT_351748 [Ascodesmis nigricans]
MGGTLQKEGVRVRIAHNQNGIYNLRIPQVTSAAPYRLGETIEQRGNESLNSSIAQQVASARYRKSINICEFDSEAKIQQALDIVGPQKVQNSVAELMCQVWILEWLETMNDYGWIGDYKYYEANDRLGAIHEK